jgi:hypothetical protein
MPSNAEKRRINIKFPAERLFRQRRFPPLARRARVLVGKSGVFCVRVAQTMSWLLWCTRNKRHRQRERVNWSAWGGGASALLLQPKRTRFIPAKAEIKKNSRPLTHPLASLSHVRPDSRCSGVLLISFIYS